MLHDVLEVSVRIWQRFDWRSVHSEFETLLRVVRVCHSCGKLICWEWEEKELFYFLQ